MSGGSISATGSGSSGAAGPAPGASLGGRVAPRLTAAAMPRFRLLCLRLLRMPGAELFAHAARELDRNAFLEDPQGSVRRALERGAARAPAAASEGPDIESVAQPGPSLRDHLARQVNADFRNPAERGIALRLVGMLDENGRLDEDPASVAAGLGRGAEEVETVLGKCRALDPAGVFARSLGDCLAIQLDRKGRLDGAVRTVLDNLELLAERDFARLGALSGLGEAELLERIAEITALDPRPASGFGHHVAPAVVPDVRVRRVRGVWRAELEDGAVPAVAVDRDHYARMRRRLRAGEDREFVRGQLRSADWLVRAIDRRGATLLRVAAEAVSRQEAFLEHGPARLEPLTMRTVAAAVGMHESTVGRAVAHKYLATEDGVFEMRRLFAAGLRRGNRSAEAVRERIRAIVAAETDATTDDGIAAALGAEGIGIARRTVAKYREEMRIPSSSRRRRMRRAAAGAARRAGFLPGDG